MSGPCLDHIAVAHIIIAVFSGTSTMLGVWLAHRRRRADRERKRFYTQMRVKHDMAPETAEDIVDRITLKRES